MNDDDNGFRLVPLVIVSAIAVAVGLATCARGETIRHDAGGSVRERIERLAAMHDERVRIVGYCASACTLTLGLPRACVTPDARLGFHGPQSRIGLPLPRDEWERVTRVMAAHYPPKLAEWFMSEARYTTGDVIEISGAEAIRMGVKECQG